MIDENIVIISNNGAYVVIGDVLGTTLRLLCNYHWGYSSLGELLSAIRGDVKVQVLATAIFCKSLQTLATTGLQTLSPVGNFSQQ